tara:strand:- start:1242 stop:1949 length:708 start_codon:yes stop_codon:yes gene_type:complete
MRKKKRNKNHYFTKVHENAIVAYTKTECNIERTELYVGYIQPAFHEMVEKITYTYKFTSLPNIDPLKEECKIWLTTILDKFDPNKGSKAFSYFSVVTKHWFIHKLKKNSAQTKREVSYDDLIKETIHEDLVTNEESYVEKREYKEFWMSLMSEIDRWENADLKVNERKVIEAIKILLSNAEQIEIFNKKAVYLYLREITGLNTKQIVNNLNKLRQKYKIFKIKWDRGDYESINRI